ncbi:MAG TPA: hypothetical protein VNM69_09605 [Bacillus sp. (in: firmicutes)]|uniref:hypothetical protein n=1 Tax=Bacillus litorisediminis TaxID=2922713 RepID=UPI001FAD23CE|nr:hypothetical protein [Bacillus litorisediminis]HWO76131.1 hypothetical protein [Bacillus sp. (in: firmicutes)]
MLDKLFSKKDSGKVLEKLNEVSEILPAADVLDFFEKLTDAYKESKMNERELAKIEAQKSILLTEIEKKYELYHKVFDRIFDERSSAINKSFEIIDKGIKDGDKNLISMGMQGLSKIVSSSPFANIQQLTDLIEGNKTIEI